MLAMIIGAICAASTLQNAGALAPPIGPAPTLDGAIGDDEWAGALRIERDGHTLFLMRDGGRVSVGVRSPAEFVITTICIRDGDRVRIVHASAALGEAVYRRDGDSWAQESTPDAWARFGHDRAAWPGLQQSFFADHGWTGSHANMGAATDTELAVALEALVDDAGEPLPFAIVLYEPARNAADSRVLLTLPADLSDDAISHGINAGFWPETASFATESWTMIDLGEGD